MYTYKEICIIFLQASERHCEVLLFFLRTFLFMHLCMYVYLHVQVPPEAKDNMESSAMELELQVVVSHSIWVPGTEPQFSTRAANVLDN